MKAEWIKPIPQPTEVSVVMSLNEAILIRELTARIHGNNPEVMSIYSALNSLNMPLAKVDIRTEGDRTGVWGEIELKGSDDE
jgi:hypothetical protein